MSEKIPGIDGDDYSEGYRKQAEALHNNKDLVEMDKLCYSVFACYPDGKDLMAELEKRFIYPMLANPNSENFERQVVFFEGLKEGIRMMKNSVVAHKQRLDADAIKASEAE